MIDEELREKQLIEDMVNVDFSSINQTSTKMHPDWESLLRLTQRKITEELGPEFKLKWDISQYSLYAFPSLSCGIVSSILICNMAVMVVDDKFDKYSIENEKIIQNIRNRSFPANGIIDKWWRLTIKDCKETMSENCLNLLLDLYADSLSQADERYKIFTGANPVSDNDFLEWRCVDSGFLIQFFFILADTVDKVTDKLLQDPNYLGLNKQAALHTSLVNDLFSLRKEIRDQVYQYNYVYVKMTNNSISAQAAVDAVIQEIRDAEKMARVHGDRLKEMNDLQLSLYVDRIYEMMAGNHYWSTFCKRYNDL